MKLGLIGCGRMGSALIKGALKAGIVSPENLYLSSRSPQSAKKLARETGGKIAASNTEVIEQADIVILGCKPRQVTAVLGEIAPALPGDTLVISVAAGTTLQTMESACPEGTRMIRAMPNTPCMIGQGATGISAGSQATRSDIENARQLMESVGIVVITPEDQLDAVTAVSGSGPAYIYTVIKALADQGQKEGLNATASLQLAARTVSGAAAMLAATGQTPGELIDQVTSPGGTTLAGLAVLAENGFEQLIADCVHAAAERSREIARN